MREAAEQSWTVRGRPTGGLVWEGDLEGAPTAVLLHGYLDHAGTWEDTVGVLAGAHGRIVAPDLRGHGKSDWAAEGHAYAFSEYVADLDALVEQLGGAVHLVGHSLGGNVASFFAGARPEAVRSLVLVDALGVEDGLEGAVVRMREHLTAQRTPPAPRVFADLSAAAERLRREHPFLPEARALSLARRGTVPVEGGVRWAWDPRLRARNAVPYRVDVHRAFLSRTRGPVHVVVPERSPFAPSAVATLLQALPSYARTDVSDCGHMVPLEAPEAVARVLRAAWCGTPHGRPGA